RRRGRGAAAVDLRRQDHHLSPPGRAGARPPATVLSRHAGGVDGGDALARRRHRRGGLRVVRAAAPPAPWLAAAAGGPALCTLLRHARRAAARRRQGARRSRSAFRRGALPARGRLSAQRGMGGDCRGHPVAADQVRPPSVARPGRDAGRVPVTNPLCLGIDIGTSGVRAIAIDAAGAVRGQASAAMPPPTRDGDSVVQDAEIWWSAVVDTLARLAPLLPLGQVRAVAFDGSSGTLLLAAGDGAPRGPARLYNDAGCRDE